MAERLPSAIRTRVTDLLGIQYPVIQGGLQNLGRARLAAAVSEAGGLGLVTAGCFEDPEEFRSELRLARSLTAKPVGVNITIGIRRNMADHLAVVLEERPAAIFTAAASPEQFAPKLREAGIPWVHVVASVRHARKAESLGVDAVVVVGTDGGGHPGQDEVGTFSLIPRAVDSLKVPVIAAGGIADGRGLAAALSLGAEGVQMGTRFVVTKECELPAAVKELYLAASELDTIIVERSLRKNLRVLATEAAKHIAALEARGCGPEEIIPLLSGERHREAVARGDVQAGLHSCGQGVGLITEEISAGEVVRQIVAQAYAQLTRVGARFGD